jgi:hypothetical protein
MTVQEVPADAVLITDSSEVSHLRSMFELLESEAYDSFFVIVKDGDYARAWGMFGIVPRNHKRLYPLI